MMYARRMRNVYVFLLFAIALAVSGCATKPPVQEMSDARQAVAAARDVGAEEYYPSLVEEANMRLDSAESNMRSGVYWAAKRDAEAAKDYAIDALLSTRHAKQESVE
jgi:hypothetical protein